MVEIACLETKSSSVFAFRTLESGTGFSMREVSMAAGLRATTMLYKPVHSYYIVNKIFITV
jgi:hypothetical protein